MKMTLSPAEAGSITQMIHISGSAALAAHDVAIGIEAVKPYTDKRAERQLVILRALAAQQARNPTGFESNLAFLKQLSLKAIL